MTRAARFVRFRSDREGSTLAVVAVFMVTLLVIMSLGIDLGMAYTARVEAQRVADAAALAGAAAFLEHPDPFDAVADAEAWARDYAGRNQIRKRTVDPNADVQVQVIVAEEKVRVWVERTGLRTWFAKLAGLDEIAVSAQAAARALDAGTSRCVKPLAIPDRWEERSSAPAEDYDGDQDMDFDNVQPCDGAGCNDNEVWTYDEASGDVYRPINQIGAAAAYPSGTATSWGSEWLDPDGADAGAQILLTPQSAQGTGTPGWYQYWKMPGSSGASDLVEAIAGCVDLGSLNLGVGNADDEIQWDAEEKMPYYPDDPTRSIWDSPRVFSVLLVHPADIQSGASHTMRIADIATVFLEVPTDPSLYGDQGNQSFKLPITGRLMKFGPGDVGPNTGVLQKYIRLVE
jgi:hypothetical protein